MFGGDEGLLLAIEGALNKLSIYIDAEELVARLSASLRSVRGGDSAMGTHTDKHNLDPDKIGCGFVGKAVAGDAKHEHVSSEDVKDLHEKVVESEPDKVILDGEHEERAVLLVYGRDWTVNSFDEELNQMYFVVDIDRAKDLIEQVVPGLGFKKEGLTVGDVQEQFECQMNETAKRLAAGKNIFKVEFYPTGSFELIHQGIVPQPEVA
jgi:hypothetical protein